MPVGDEAGDRDQSQSPAVDGEHLVTRRARGLALDTPVYRMGMPRLRARKRFYRLTHLLPALVVLAVVVFVIARVIGATTSWQNFAATNPCVLPESDVFGFPAWLRSMHWFNLLLMAVLFRSGIQILADHPRLYRTVHSTPGREWLRFRGPVPEDRVWTAVDDSMHLTPMVGLPGGRHTSGVARHWHFLSVPLWVLLGVAFIVLLFTTGQWRQLVPTTTAIVPSSLTCAVTYSGLEIPPGDAVSGFNALQQLTYFAVVFIAAPLAILTGIAMSPALGHRFAWYERIFGNRQIARSLHFLVWCFIAIFFVIHVTLVLVTGLARNMNHMVLGTDGQSWWGAIIGLGIVAAVIGLLALASGISWRSPRGVQHAFEAIAEPLNGLLFDRMAPRVEYREDQISPFMWPNGKIPSCDAYQQLKNDGFSDYRLRVYGDVEEPREFSLDELKALSHHEQITEHDCVQGWSAIAKWGGVQISEILDAVRPKEGARYAIFYAFKDEGVDDYYDAHDLTQLRNPDSILAYEMNGGPLPLLHGAPLRLRNESELGFKQIKWIESIEIARDYTHVGEGQGGHREDAEFLGRRAEI